MQYMLIMAGVLGQLFRPQKKAMYRDPKIMELETAKEILAEVFKVRLSEVDEMIHNRFEVASAKILAAKTLAAKILAVKNYGHRNSRSENESPFYPIRGACDHEDPRNLMMLSEKFKYYYEYSLIINIR